MENDTFTIIDKNKRVVQCKVLFTYKDKENNKNYVVYTDGTRRINGTLNAFAASYKEKEGFGSLTQITSEKEYKMISKIFNAITKKN